MSVAEAYNDGKQAFIDGKDLQHMPGHYSIIEQENYIQGYNDQASCVPWDHSDDLEDPSLSELDFN
jgi:hypothetical protein